MRTRAVRELARDSGRVWQKNAAGH